MKLLMIFILVLLIIIIDVNFNIERVVIIDVIRSIGPKFIYSLEKTEDLIIGYSLLLKTIETIQEGRMIEYEYISKLKPKLNIQKKLI
jgi:hypothetical protein